MKVLRNKVILRFTTLVTGIVFLNMSFFLAEVSALKLTKDKKMTENIAKLIAGAASEEEKDACSSSAEEDAKGLTELDLLLDHKTLGSYTSESPYQLTYLATQDQKTLTGARDTVIQPPEA
jgi:hypothetical protein